MPDTSNKAQSDTQCTRRYFFHALLTSFYALALIALPFSFNHDTGQLSVTTAFADDDGGSDGGDDGFDDSNDGRDDDDGDDDRHGDSESSDDSRDDRSGDGSAHHDGPDSNSSGGDRFDFGDLENLDPMSPEEESGVVGHWD